MTNIATTSRDNPEFARVIAVSQLRGIDAFPFDFVPTPDEATAIARLLDARGLRKMRFHGRLLPEAAGAWRLEAELGASVTQTCVITLEPVVSRIDVPVTRLFVPDLVDGGTDGPAATGRDDDEEIDPLGDRLDLGRVALEALALALPDYPRKPGAVLGTLAAGPDDPAGSGDAEIRPFAALAALRGKVDGAG